MAVTGVTTGQKQRLAEQTLGIFVNEMIDSFGSQYVLDQKQTIARAVEKDSQYLNILGMAVYEWSTYGMGLRRLGESVERVVSRLEDENRAIIPPVQYFIDAMQAEMTSFDFALVKDVTLDIAISALDTVQKGTDKGIEVLGSVAKNVEEGVKNIGNSIESTTSGISTLTKALPVIIIGVIGVVLLSFFSIAKNSSVKDLKP